MPLANQKCYIDFLFLYFYGAMQLDVKFKMISAMDTNDSFDHIHEKGTSSLIPKHSIYVFYHILGPKIRYGQIGYGCASEVSCFYRYGRHCCQEQMAHYYLKACDEVRRAVERLSTIHR